MGRVGTDPASTRPATGTGPVAGTPARTVPPTPVLEIGGTHVTAALVSTGESAVVAAERVPLDSAAGAPAILDRLALAAQRIDAPAGAAWGVAIPGPFDYEAGVGSFTGVGKFDSLHGVRLGDQLLRHLRPAPGSVRFVNDATAYGLGEWAAGAARGHDRSVCLTLGTGIGSVFVADGVPVDDGPDVPPDGHAYLLTWRGEPLEETVSRRALRTRYAALTGEAVDVHEIAARARQGDPTARLVVDDALRALGCVMAPWIRRFGASLLVVGGSVARSWDLVEGPLGEALTAEGVEGVVVAQAEHLEEAPLHGAAMWATAATASVR